VNSEIARGLDLFELKPRAFISQNEIDAAKTVQFTELNAQGRPRLVWPPSFVLARSFVDQLDRSNCLPAERIAAVRASLSSAERAGGATRQSALTGLASQLSGEAGSSCDASRVRKLSDAVRDLAVVS
jgi:hypothetical protein